MPSEVADWIAELPNRDSTASGMYPLAQFAPWTNSNSASGDRPAMEIACPGPQRRTAQRDKLCMRRTRQCRG
jgi:hypothetical protein